jgi:hypothetical protein
MSEERFAEILNELQARGDKTKLMQLRTLRAHSRYFPADSWDHLLLDVGKVIRKDRFLRLAEAV